jgi:proteasome lid subunit RPN8/RPN11
MTRFGRRYPSVSESSAPRFEALPLPAAVRDRMARHAEAAYPEEACGALFGLPAGRSLPIVTDALPLLNQAQFPDEGFQVDPRELEQVCRTLKAPGEILIGFYHSHPEGSPRPSTLDVRFAPPGLWQITIPVVGGRSGARRAWRVDGAVTCPR